MVEKKNNTLENSCHRIGEAEKKLYSFVAEYFGKENTFFVMNVDPSTVKVPEGYNRIIFNHETILSSEQLCARCCLEMGAIVTMRCLMR